MEARQSGQSEAFAAAVRGAALGSLLALPALGAAFLSARGGHGDYAAARALFPFGMLMTQVEGSIGLLSVGIALLQIPLYGALVGWSRWRRSYGALVLVAALHLTAAVICFSGVLPDFS